MALWEEQEVVHARLMEIMGDAAGLALAVDRHTVVVYLNAEKKPEERGKLAFLFSQLPANGISELLNLNVVKHSRWVAGAAGDPPSGTDRRGHAHLGTPPYAAPQAQPERRAEFAAKRAGTNGVDTVGPPRACRSRICIGCCHSKVTCMDLAPSENRASDPPRSDDRVLQERASGPNRRVGDF